MSIQLKAIQAQALPILKKYKIKRAGFFGSVLREDFKVGSSDIDILVELPQEVHGFDYVNLKVNLQEELEQSFGRPVDIVEYHLIKPSLKEYILPTQVQIL